MEESWKESQALIDIITQTGTIQKYFESLSQEIRSQAIGNPDDGLIVVCIDEGCTHEAHVGDNPELNLAGSGILYSPEEAAKMLGGKKIKMITSHEGCGAAGLAGKDAEEWTQELVAVLNKDRSKYAEPSGEVPVATGEKITYKHVTLNDMDRPQEFHNARAIYYNLGENTFDASRVRDENSSALMPSGFTIDAGHFPEANSLKELEVALSIAFGEHGFGEYFTSDNPLLVIIIGETTEEQQKDIQQKLEEYRERVVMETLVV